MRYTTMNVMSGMVKKIFSSEAVVNGLRLPRTKVSSCGAPQW